MPKIEINQAPFQMILIIGLGVLMSLASLFLAVGIGGDEPASLVPLIGWVGFAFFGAMTALGLWQLVTTRGPVVTLTATGITDTRVASEEIPWTAIGDIGVWSMHGTKVIVLAVAPEVEAGLTLTRLARMSRGANAKLGADGLCTQANNLKITHDALLEKIRAYHQAAVAQVSNVPG